MKIDVYHGLVGIVGLCIQSLGGGFFSCSIHFQRDLFSDYYDRIDGHTPHYHVVIGSGGIVC